MGNELWSGQAQNGVNSDFEVKFDLEGQGQLPPKTIGTLTKVFCIFGPNLAILAWTGPELSRGQASDWHTDRHTDTQTHRQTQATTIPEGQNWPRVKINATDIFNIPKNFDHHLNYNLNKLILACFKPIWIFMSSSFWCWGQNFCETRSILWLVMLWLLASPGHPSALKLFIQQHPGY